INAVAFSRVSPSRVLTASAPSCVRRRIEARICWPDIGANSNAALVPIATPSKKREGLLKFPLHSLLIADFMLLSFANGLQSSLTRGGAGVGPNNLGRFRPCHVNDLEDKGVKRTCHRYENL